MNGDLDHAIRRQIEAIGLKPKCASTIDISGMDDFSKSMRKQLPAHARAAYDENWANRKKPSELSPKRNSTEPTRVIPEPPAPKGHASPNNNPRCSGRDAVFEAAFGRLPLGNISEAERQNVYADMEKAILATKKPSDRFNLAS